MSLDTVLYEYKRSFDEDNNKDSNSFFYRLGFREKPFESCDNSFKNFNSDIDVSKFSNGLSDVSKVKIKGVLDYRKFLKLGVFAMFSTVLTLNAFYSEFKYFKKESSGFQMEVLDYEENNFSKEDWDNLKVLVGEEWNKFQLKLEDIVDFKGDELDSRSAFDNEILDDMYLNVDNNLSSKYSRHTFKGMFYRTARWDRLICETEKKYELEEGILAGLIMRESRGDPLALNNLRDGGAGLCMLQPGIAKFYGGKVLNNNGSVNANFKHGDKLYSLVREYGFDYESLKVVDHRFDAEKNIDIAAQFLFDLSKRYNNWDDVLSAYNRGTPAKNPKRTRHVEAVRDYQIYYLNEKKKLGKYVNDELLFNLQKNVKI